MPHLRTAATAILVAMLPSAVGAQDAPDMKKIDAGEAVYNDYCQTCHGTKMVNTGLSSFDLRKLRDDERERFERSVTNGKNQMPPWRGVLDAEQMDAIWHYIRFTAKEMAK